MEPQKPSIGRIVHYITGNIKNKRHLPGIITAVNDDGTINIVIFNEYTGGSYDEEAPQHAKPKYSIRYDESGKIDSWHWPEKVQ